MQSKNRFAEFATPYDDSDQAEAEAAKEKPKAQKTRKPRQKRPAEMLVDGPGLDANVEEQMAIFESIKASSETLSGRPSKPDRKNLKEERKNGIDLEAQRACMVCSGEVYFKEQIYRCPCFIAICNECSFNWASSQIHDQMQREVPAWKCPQPDPLQQRNPQQIQLDRLQDFPDQKQACKSFSISQIVNMYIDYKNRQRNLSDEKAKQVDEWTVELCGLQLKHYVIHCQDMRTCPNAKCGYAGSVLIDIDTEHIECEKPLLCPECLTEWRDPLQQITRGAGLITKFKRLNRSRQRLATYFRELLISKPCPNCGVMIQKSGGCPHMTCFKCKYEFCWHCMGHYARYRHEPGMEKYCGQAFLATGALIAIFILLSLVKILTTLVSTKTFNHLYACLPAPPTFAGVLYAICIFIFAHVYLVVLIISYAYGTWPLGSWNPYLSRYKQFVGSTFIVQVTILSFIALVTILQFLLSDFQHNAMSLLVFELLMVIFCCLLYLSGAALYLLQRKLRDSIRNRTCCARRRYLMKKKID